MKNATTNTFDKYSIDFEKFLETVFSGNPDYIVPVERKGCKLLRSYRNILSANNFQHKVRYRQFFENINIDLQGKKIAVIDDATKYTSTLQDYRLFFESKGAIVETYSFIGLDKLETAENQQYDKQANIYKFLNESTYQEYIIQQSYSLSCQSVFFDIDHFILHVNLTKKEYVSFKSELSDLGRIIYPNDVYTPKNLEKISFYCFDFFESLPFMKKVKVSLGNLKKIRFCYNYDEGSLTIAPMAFPVWSSKNFECDKKNFLEPSDISLYEITSSLSKDGYFQNLSFIYHVCLYKAFVQKITQCKFKMPNIDEFDLAAYVGSERANFLIRQIKTFIKSPFIDFSNKTNAIKMPLREKETLTSVHSLMDELRGEYLNVIKNRGTVLGSFYFLSYDEIRTRYTGRSNINKWIDILCDRGVLVARNIKNTIDDTIYHRAYRSGEGDYDHIEKKSGLLIPIVINFCGESQTLTSRKGETKNICAIEATYLNKVLANLAYDYPLNENDFHALFTKPYNFGPMTYIKNSLNDEIESPIYSPISEHYFYDENEKKFFSKKCCDIQHEINSCFSSKNAVPFSEITLYLGLLKEFKNTYAKADILNCLAICRDEDTYFRHIFYNLKQALENIQYVKRFDEVKIQEKRLRDAATLIKAAFVKLNYDQRDILLKLGKSVGENPFYMESYEKIKESFVPFNEKFMQEAKPLLEQVCTFEKMQVYLMLFLLTCDCEFLAKFLKTNKGQAFLTNDIVIDSFEECIRKQRKKESYDKTTILKIVTNLEEELYQKLIENFKKIPKVEEKDYVKKQKERTYEKGVNQATHFLKNMSGDNFTLLQFSFANTRNLNNNKYLNITHEMQVLSSSIVKSYNAEIIQGKTGSENSITIVFEMLSDALFFAGRLRNYISNNPDTNQIKLKFGIAYRSGKKNAEAIDSAWRDTNKSIDHLSDKFANVDNLMISQSSIEFMRGELLDYVNNSFFSIGKESNVELFCYKEFHEDEIVVKENNTTKEDVRIGIITALTQEYVAVKKMLKNPKKHIFPVSNAGAGNEFIVGEMKSVDGKKHLVALAQTLGPGNEIAAVRASSMIYYFPNMIDIIMVGIAGGTPDITNISKHVRLGDIVASEQGIYEYKFISEKLDSEENKSRTPSISARLVQAQKALDADDFEGKYVWRTYIDAAQKAMIQFKKPSLKKDILYDYEKNPIVHPNDSSRDKYPKVFKGKIATANSVQKNPMKRDKLKKEHGVMAIEMEASGIAQATWSHGIGYYVVRGVSDYCDENKSPLDEWHSYASLAAAAYARALIEKIDSKLS